MKLFYIIFLPMSAIVIVSLLIVWLILLPSALITLSVNKLGNCLFGEKYTKDRAVKAVDNLIYKIWHIILLKT
ncbi:MAG: hypothetical protein LBP54_03980 [Campylobacteraceae bacterium]|jgi:ABC-type phosphate transport system permease subunit|nr:hypothetical protein [Campylobacteraceae bacterium]